ncbi:hypothetical protein [Enterobacter roggenkampii]|uniref:hypothetical protein n=1 Tax=Enterobacter roggenkampii TaxID=1812935 RepID=UPI001F365EF2|nr:hypothetical protein [Enterobacter roggenkampii]
MRYFIKVCLVLSCILTTLTWYMGWFRGLDDSAIRSASSVAAQVSATLLGFLIAALAILASVTGSRLIRNMQESGHYRVLLKKIFIVSVWYALSLIVGCWAVISPIQFLYVSAFICLGTFLASVLMLGDIGWRFWMVLKNI